MSETFFVMIGVCIAAVTLYFSLKDDLLGNAHETEPIAFHQKKTRKTKRGECPHF